MEKLYSRLDEPYNECLKDPLMFHLNKTLINYFIKSARSYSQKECYQMCFNLKNQEASFELLEQVFKKCFSNQYDSIYDCSVKFKKYLSNM